MKLLYLWVEEYGILKDAAFNFDSNIRFQYNKENNGLTRVESKNEIPEDFFSLNIPEGNTVESVSAIVGNNGAGKSTVFKLINKLLWNTKGLKFILVFQKFDRAIYIKSVLKSYKIKEFLLGDVFEFGNEAIRHKNNLKENIEENNDDVEGRYPFTLFYYSNYFNPQGYDYLPDNTIDLSTTYLINRDYERFYNTGTVTPGEAPPQNKIFSHSAKEFIRNIEFIKKYEEWKQEDDTFSFGFNLPTGVVIKINEEDSSILDYQVRKGSEDVRECFKKFKEAFIFDLPDKNSDENINEVSKETFLYNISKAIIYNYLRGNSSLRKPLPQTPIDYWGKMLETIEELQNNESIDWRKIFLNYFEKMGAGFDVVTNKKRIKYRDRQAPNILSFFKIFERIPRELFGYMGDQLRLNLLNEEEESNFKDVIGLYFGTKTITDYLLFSWSPHISAGEQSYFNLFSRFIGYMESNGAYTNKEDFLIFFDEVETTMHPKWQKGIVENLILFFEKFFIKSNHKLPKKHIHLFFATHSPILLSDIPIDNCCFLKRNGNKSEIMTGAYEDLKAFGSNIYNLYRSSFFMDNGLMGSFAENKIKKVIQTISKKELDQKEFENCRKLINNIGEDVLKIRLLEIISQKIPKENLIEMEIKELEERLANLRKESEK